MPRPRPSELIYAARTRCSCGAGLAYAKGDPCPAWTCSAVLLGQAEDGVSRHSGPRPLAFHSIAAEPFGRGPTTRPRRRP